LPAGLVSKRSSPTRPPDVRPRPLQLSVVIPTFNERQSVRILLARLDFALSGIEWEATYVDDHSPDGTSDLVREIARTNRRVRLIERVGRRGLASACIEGMMASAAPYIAVMDGDLQHDETVLPKMLQKMESGRFDIVIASRAAAGGGSMGEFSEGRVRLSNIGTRIGKSIARSQVSDVMSGFFLVEARFFRAVAPRLTRLGFKILLDILASSETTPTAVEVPYRFDQRQFGESKLDLSVKLEYLFFIVDKLMGKWVPTRFLLFMLIGTTGLLVHFVVLATLHFKRPPGFPQFQVVAALFAMTSNFVLNNVITFCDRRLRGRRLAAGLLKFYGVCSIGALINVAFATTLINQGIRWNVAVAAGMSVSGIWNYSVNSVLIWKQCRQ